MDTKTLGIIVFVLCICLCVAIEFKKRTTFKTLLQLLNKKAYGDYLTLLNTPFVKLVYPKFNHSYMKLNAYMFMEDHEEITRLFEEMLRMKVSHKQRVDLVTKAFNYYIECNDKEHASMLMEEIETYDDAALKLECRKIYDIFILKKYQYIEEMEARLSQVKGMEKGFLEYLLSLQYENKGDMKKSKQYFEQSQENMLAKQEII